MAGTVQTLNLADLPAWGDSLDRLPADTDFGPLFSDIKVMLAASAKENFDSQHAPDGTPWIGLKRPRPDGSNVPLRDKGILMASMTANGPGHWERQNKTTLEWGTNLDYAHVHQEGMTVHHPERTRAKPWVFLDSSGDKIFTRNIKAHDVLIPARPFLGFNDELAEDIGSAVAEFVSERI